MVFTHTRREDWENDLISLDDGDTYSSAEGTFYVLDGKVYDLVQIINFFFDNATEETKDGITVRDLE